MCPSGSFFLRGHKENMECVEDDEFVCPVVKDHRSVKNSKKSSKFKKFSKENQIEDTSNEITSGSGYSSFVIDEDNGNALNKQTNSSRDSALNGAQIQAKTAKLTDSIKTDLDLSDSLESIELMMAEEEQHKLRTEQTASGDKPSKVIASVQIVNTHTQSKPKEVIVKPIIKEELVFHDSSEEGLASSEFPQFCNDTIVLVDDGDMTFRSGKKDAFASDEYTDAMEIANQTITKQVNKANSTSNVRTKRDVDMSSGTDGLYGGGGGGGGGFAQANRNSGLFYYGIGGEGGSAGKLKGHVQESRNGNGAAVYSDTRGMAYAAGGGGSGGVATDGGAGGNAFAINSGTNSGSAVAAGGEGSGQGSAGGFAYAGSAGGGSENAGIAIAKSGNDNQKPTAVATSGEGEGEEQSVAYATRGDPQRLQNNDLKSAQAGVAHAYTYKNTQLSPIGGTFVTIDSDTQSSVTKTTEDDTDDDDFK